jgi:Xaa-Pro aminopeptidase
MLPPSVVKDRVGRTLDRMTSQNIDALILFSREDIRYLAAFDQACICLVIPKEGNPTALGLWLDIDEARRQSWVQDTRGFVPQYHLRIGGGEAQRRRLVEVLIEKGLSRGRIGIERGLLTLEMFDTLKSGLPEAVFVDATPVLKGLRIVKSKEEVELIRRASEIADCAMEAVSQITDVGRKESDLAAEAEYVIRRSGGEVLSKTLVGSGKRTLCAHPFPTEKTLEREDLVYIDIHPSYKGYHSDLCRTFLLGRDATKEKAHETLVAAQRATFEATAPGIDPEQIYKAGISSIESSIYGRNFLELYGHGTGLNVEEPPMITKGCREKIDENMTISFFQGALTMPGSYGLRIEDTGVVTKKGVKLFTRYPTDLLR